MKRVELLFNLFAIPLDAAAVFASAVFAYFLRLRFQNTFPIYFQIDAFDYIKTILLVLPFLLLLFALHGLYNVRSTDRLGREIVKIISAITLALVIVVLTFFFDRNVFPSRLIVLLTWGSTLVALSAGRIFLRFLRDRQLRRGQGAHKLAVIIGPKTNQRILTDIQNTPELGFTVVAVIDSGSPNLMADLEVLHKQGLDEILQGDPEFSPQDSAELLRFCHDRGIKFNFIPDIFDVSASRMEVEMIGESPIIKLKGTPLDGWGRVLKRIVDVIFSLLALVLLSPIYLLIYLAIKLDSPGPAIFVQSRANDKGEFPFYKFRSMYTHLSEGEGYGGAEAQKVLEELVTNQNGRGGPVWKIKNDPRITRVGAFLRKYKLDELPQFWNVLKGEMSLVGPRAHQMNQVIHYANTNKRLFTIKPGLTGLTQITQLHNQELPFEEEVRIDTYYIENWSLWLDLKIVLRTSWLLATLNPPKENYG